MKRGSAQGIAIHESFGTIVGQVAEVTVASDGSMSVERIVSVADCAKLVNPLRAEAQIEGVTASG
ncbi:MAG: hypothetical protein CMQ05_12605 [Gammaproteobacteria bacterium]|nr:hypothetical protein [Gammaproteobacteria bacterium]RPG25210.1 MAG: hypothetical protein CBC10_008845 [Gammaproteobacteria bacterium TMED50]|tara:strand:- start:1889 stop:2083 length:195 start_codon:yes stop_codon:yes gene_type:complete